MIRFDFNLDKTLAAVAVLLERQHGRMEHYRLLKLLYVADRELLAEKGRTITGDDPIAKVRGPLLKHVCDLIAGRGDPQTRQRWNAVVQRDGAEVSLVKHPGVGKLNRSEVAKLTEISQRFWDVDAAELGDRTHAFPEYEKAFAGQPDGATTDITWEAVLEAQGEGDFIPHVEARIEEGRAIAAAFRE